MDSKIYDVDKIKARIEYLRASPDEYVSNTLTYPTVRDAISMSSKLKKSGIVHIRSANVLIFKVLPDGRMV